MQPRQLLINALNTRRQKYRQEFNRARAEFSEESVHDLRVATRRLLALLDLLHLVVPELPLKRIQRDLKGQLDSLDPLRDTQVMLIEVRERAATLPSLLPFLAHLEKQEHQALKDAADSLGSISFVAASRLNSDLLGLRDQLQGRSEVGDPVAAADDAFARVILRYQAVDPALPASIHRVRVAFKRFRYTIEIIHRLLPDFPRANLKEMDDYQTGLGRLQDAEVILRSLEGFSAHDGTFDPAPGRSYYEQRHGEVIASALEGMSEVHSFWRPAPDGAFPWEQTQ